MLKIGRPVIVCAALLACWATADVTGLASVAKGKTVKRLPGPEADRSTPRAGLRVFLAANEAKDRLAAADCFHVRNKQDHLLARALALLGTAQTQLRQAVRVRLGGPAERELCGHIVRAADVGKLRVEENGDTAVVYVSEDGGFPMIKVDGNWLISPSAMAAREKRDALVLATVYVDFATRHALAAKGVLEGRFQTTGEISKYIETGRYDEAADAAK